MAGWRDVAGRGGAGVSGLFYDHRIDLVEVVGQLYKSYVTGRPPD